MKLVRQSVEYGEVFDAPRLLLNVHALPRLAAPAEGDPPLTPVYDSLTTNVPHPTMGFLSLPFPHETPIYPPAEAVHKYLQHYAEHFGLLEHIKLNSSVSSVTRDKDAGKWVVTTRNAVTEDDIVSYDFVIVANGHYHVPRVPTTPGLQTWLDAGRAQHSIYYRNPSSIGTAQTLLVRRAVLHRPHLIGSITNGKPSNSENPNLKIRGRVAHCDTPASNRVVFEDGTALSGIDHVVLGTGYEAALPFLAPDVLHVAIPPRARARTSRGARELDSIVPMPCYEAQAIFVAHVFAHPAALDLAAETDAVTARYDLLRARFSRPPSSPLPSPADAFSGAPPGPALDLAVAKAWDVFEGHAQFAYRDALRGVAGDPVRVEDWEREATDARLTLRDTWKSL
ncbi:FAD/NAD(P)-binding domain-containing protein [Epithele typhae]|uniref:FAD/NAD(P)-binding domain-containing protein n=1 Tax=Epithele typhae TaxID=378194 RepID=UPI002007BF7F|nr:FAD/NAD(P)-binding domain-containing protein [Epithele typhae]KAH9941604.1 FAD/NAD(P)-binding domain-containing protein [Epithele typhae]